MSRVFVAASSQYLSRTGAILDAVPITMAAWFRLSSAGAFQSLISLSDVDVDNQFMSLRISSLEVVNAVVNDGGSAVTASSSTAATVGVWAHGCAVFASATSRAAYLNGGGKGTETTSKTPANFDTTSIGRSGRSVNTHYADSLIAEAAIWNAALTDDEVLMLARGYLPTAVRRGNLVAYWPLSAGQSPEQDNIGGYALTLTNAPAYSTASPPLIRVASGAGRRGRRSR